MERRDSSAVSLCATRGRRIQACSAAGFRVFTLGVSLASCACSSMLAWELFELCKEIALDPRESLRKSTNFKNNSWVN